MPSHSTPREEVTDPIEHEHDIETSSLAARELARLLDQDDMDFGSTTVRIDARELDALLDQARPEHERRVQNRPVPAPPPSRPMLTTQPYDAVTAYALLDKDDVPLEPPTDAPDADDLVEAEDDDDDLEPTSGPVDAEPIAPVIEAEAEAAVALPAAPIVAAPAPPPLSTPPAVSAWASASTTTPLPAPIASSPARASLPSAAAPWADEDARKRRSRMVVAIVGVLAAMGLVYLVVTEPDATPTAPAPTAAVPVPPPPAPSAPAPQSLAEIDARTALTHLREGMGDCVRRAIGSLPGSSPAVPATMKQTSGIGYTATPADWKTAVWSCAKFRHDAPMQFQIQWQSLKPGLEAVGLAWIDDNGDGEADRVLGFHATAKGAHDVDLGEIAPMEMRPVVPVH
jgi:hypothetical protein